MVKYWKLCVIQCKHECTKLTPLFPQRPLLPKHASSKPAVTPPRSSSVFPPSASIRQQQQQQQQWWWCRQAKEQPTSSSHWCQQWRGHTASTHQAKTEEGGNWEHWTLKINMNYEPMANNYKKCEHLNSVCPC